MKNTLESPMLVSGWGSSACWTRVVGIDYWEGENGEG